MGETVLTGSELLPNASTSTTSKPHIYKDDEDNHKLPNKNISHIPPTAFKKGHRRGDSKTEFILPPGHEERERKRALQRSVGAVNYHNILVAIKVELTDKTVTSNFKDLGLIVVQRGVLNLSKNQKRCMKWAEYQPLNPLFHLHLLMYKSIVAKKDMEEPIHTVFPSEVILDR